MSMFNFFKRLFGKAGKDYSLIVCSKCGSGKVQVTTCVSEEKDFIEGGITYDRYTYGVRCRDCGAVGVFTEKWENALDNNGNQRIYVTLVDDPSKCNCPCCGNKELIPSDQAAIKHSIDSSYKLYVCKKCNTPVCATKIKDED